MTRFCMFNLHIVTHLEAKSNVSIRYILKLWVSKTKKLDLLMRIMMNRKFLSWKICKEGVYLLNFSLTKKLKIEKKEITNSSVPSDGFIFINWIFFYLIWPTKTKLLKKKPIVHPMTDFFFMNVKKNWSYLTD